MKTARQKTYKVELKWRNSTIEQLVEADSIIEATEVVKSHYEGLKDDDIIGVHTYSSVIKKLTKTLTIDV